MIFSNHYKFINNHKPIKKLNSCIETPKPPSSFRPKILQLIT